MYSRLYQGLVLVGALALTSGCVQATRHSNTLVFGTNTSFGVKVGTDATQIPSIIVGYDRQEAVILPLVANTSEGDGDDRLLEPCDLTKDVSVDGGEYAVHPCNLVAINGSAMDSYSVLASFGAKFDGSSSTTKAEAKGGLAQYFATGMAAQMLAMTGGASVVAVGGAATKSAENQVGPNDLASLYSNDAAFKKGIQRGSRFNKLYEKLLGKVAASTNNGKLKTNITAFEKSSNSSLGLAAICVSSSPCVTAIKNAESNLEISNLFDADAPGFEKGISDWKD